MTSRRKSIVNVIIAVAVLAAGLTALTLMQSARHKTVERSDFLMDTFIEQRITGADAQQTIDRIYEALRELDGQLDRYDEASELSAINAAAGRHPVAVSDSTYALLKRAVELAEETGGVFDPAIGPLTALWHEAKEAGIPPDDEVIARLLPLVDYRRILFDDDAQTVMLAEEGMSLDLGGIAKGYASDVIQSICREADIDTALISLGGNVYSCGAPEGRDSYSIGIRDPRSGESNPVLSLHITDMVLATSAAYERYFEYEGTVYHHILDTATGSPAVTDLLSITVVSADGTLADCLSTTLYIEGMESVRDIIRRQQAGESLPFSVIAIDREGEIHISPDLREKATLFGEKDYHFAGEG